LEFCLLRIRVGDETELCQLSDAQSVEPAAIDFSLRRQSVDVPLPVGGSAASKHLRFDVAVAGYAHDVEMVRGRALDGGRSGCIRLFEPGPRRSLDDPFLELDIKLEQDEQRTRLVQTVEFARETGQPFVTPPKTALAREWFEQIARESVGEQKRLAGLAEEIGQQLAAAERKLDEAKAKAARILERAPQKPGDYATEQQILDYKRRLQMLERELIPVREQAAKAEQEAALLGKLQQDGRAKIAAWKGVSAWTETTLARLDEVETKVRIHYRIYVMIGKREVELLRTDGGVF
jgi:hypothetical protein